MRARKQRGDEDEKSFKPGGRGRDSCSPEVCVDIPVVDGEGYLVVLSACL